MIKKSIPLFFCSFFVFFLSTNLSAKEKINWITLSEAQQKIKEKPKPILIDLYTNWCYWCKVMDNKTYQNQKVVKYINENFYAVKLNAESENQLFWNEQKFNYNKDNKLNDFALYVTAGQPGFPTTVIFTGLKQNPAAIPGYMSPREIEGILKYFGEDYYEKESFESFSANFKNTW